MTASSPASASVFAEKTSRISSWLDELPPTPSTEEEGRLLKRKRTSLEQTTAHQLAIMPAQRHVSPAKRQRWDTDELLPEQSASVVWSHPRPLTLSDSNTFSPPSSRAALSTSTPRRGNSPSRGAIAKLRIASPPIISEPLNGLEREPPARVMAVVARLEDGLDHGWIPGWLEGVLKADTTLGFQKFEPSAFSKTPTRDFSDPGLGAAVRADLEYTSRKVRKIYKEALHCQTRGRDENAWCDDVVRPLVKLALRLYAKGQLRVQSVQSQNIDPEFLSYATEASGKQRVIDRKADYTLSYSHDALPFQSLYSHLLQHRNECVSHTTDAFTQTTAVFSGIEVKPSDGEKAEAQYQLSIWMAASLRKKAKLARCAGLYDTACLVEPGFTVVGHDLNFYVAYLDSMQDGVAHVLEFGNAATNSVSGVFKQLKMWQNVVQYALDDGPAGFWGGFMKSVLESLAASQG